MSDSTPIIVNGHPLRVAELAAGAFLARYPQSTRDCYRIHLRQWFDWLQANGIQDPMTVKRPYIEAWARHHLEERNLKPASVASKLNAVCGFYKFSFIDGMIEANPAAHVRRPTVEWRSTTNGLTRTQLADMLKAAENHSPTAHALTCLLGLSGLRIGEALGADIEHLGRHRGYETITLPHRKGDKIATVALATPTAWAISRAIEDRTSGPILLGRNSARLHERAARRLVAKLAEEIGLSVRVTPHSLRHAFITLALDAGVPERDIVDSAGHRDARMIRYYDRNRNAVERNATHAVAAFVHGAG